MKNSCALRAPLPAAVHIQFTCLLRLSVQSTELISHRLLDKCSAQNETSPRSSTALMLYTYISRQRKITCAVTSQYDKVWHSTLDAQSMIQHSVNTWQSCRTGDQVPSLLLHCNIDGHRSQQAQDLPTRNVPRLVFVSRLERVPILRCKESGDIWKLRLTSGACTHCTRHWPRQSTCLARRERLASGASSESRGAELGTLHLSVLRLAVHVCCWWCNRRCPCGLRHCTNDPIRFQIPCCVRVGGGTCWNIVEEKQAQTCQEGAVLDMSNRAR